MTSEATSRPPSCLLPPPVAHRGRNCGHRVGGLGRAWRWTRSGVQEDWRRKQGPSSYGCADGGCTSRGDVDERPREPARTRAPAAPSRGHRCHPTTARSPRRSGRARGRLGSRPADGPAGTVGGSADPPGDGARRVRRPPGRRQADPGAHRDARPGLVGQESHRARANHRRPATGTGATQGERRAGGTARPRGQRRRCTRCDRRLQRARRRGSAPAARRSTVVRPLRDADAEVTAWRARRAERRELLRVQRASLASPDEPTGHARWRTRWRRSGRTGDGRPR